MQLFITNFKINGDTIDIEDLEILDQIRKVLRMKLGDSIFVQNEDTRYELKITDRDQKTFSGKIKNKTKFDGKKDQNGIAIAMPNKRDKIELLVQKISEIGIKNIYFRPSERSIIRERNGKKVERINKIAKEAIEQSRGRELPKITFEKNISKITDGKDVIVFDKTNDSKHNGNIPSQNTLGIIGPEGGLTQNDYKKFGKNYKILSLGDTILRTETAGIIAARLIKNVNLF